LGSVNGINSTSEKAIPVSRNLIVENGHIDLSWKGTDIRGRMVGGQASEARPLTIMSAGRATGVMDTILVQWRGKHLVRLPVTADSSGIVFALDTGWNDDQGIGWNPRVNYGSIFDARDGEVYRTIHIGTQIWMAQNLNYRNNVGSTDTAGLCYGFSMDSCAKYGRLYTWGEAVGASTHYDTFSLYPSAPVQGICPSGWHVPADSEWTKLTDTTLSTYDSVQALSIVLASRSGWTNLSAIGTDSLGFRALPAGDGNWSGGFQGEGMDANFWTTADPDSQHAEGRTLILLSQNPSLVDLWFKADGLSIRCLKN